MQSESNERRNIDQVNIVNAKTEQLNIQVKQCSNRKAGNLRLQTWPVMDGRTSLGEEEM